MMASLCTHCCDGTEHSPGMSCGEAAFSLAAAALCSPAIVGAIIFVAGLVTLEVIVAQHHSQTAEGANLLPYVSDLGSGSLRDRIIFTASMSVSAALFTYQLFGRSVRYAKRVQEVLDAKEETGGRMCSCFGTWLAACVLCSIAQCSLAIMYVNEAPIAQLPAVYIILMSLVIPTFTILLCRVQSTLPPAVGARSLKFKLVASVLFIVSAVVYLPAGQFAVGAANCATTVRTAATFTSINSTATLASFAANLGKAMPPPSACARIHTVRAAAELSCFLLAALFLASFAMEDAALCGLLLSASDGKGSACESAGATRGPGEAAPLNSRRAATSHARAHAPSSGAPRSWASERLDELYGIKSMSDPEEVRAQLPMFAG